MSSEGITPYVGWFSCYAGSFAFAPRGFSPIVVFPSSKTQVISSDKISENSLPVVT